MNTYPENETPSGENAPAASPRNAAAPRGARYGGQEVYTDASYVPRDQAPQTPRTYTYAEPEHPERKHRRGIGPGGVIALCLVCVLLGGFAGLAAIGYFPQLSERFSAADAATVQQSVPAPTPAPAPTDPPETERTVVRAPDGETPAEGEEEAPTQAPESEAEAPAAEPETEESGTGSETEDAAESKKPVLSTNTEGKSQLAATDIYELACRQVVGIATEVTYQSYYGPQNGTVTGSGFIISSDGYILTNYHVIEYAAEGGYPVTVMLYNGDSYPATIVGYENDDSDVAVLKIDAAGLDAAVLGDSDSIRVGESIYAVGNPLGELDYTMTRGIISAMDREITTDNGSTAINMFQIDAAVNSGNSGGPVYNGEGKVVGIVTAKYSDTYAEMGIEGLGFAIPIGDAVNIANDLIQNGYVRGKAYMGISTKSVSSAAAQYYNMVEGAYVYGLVDGSCAQAAGLHMGDIITAVDRFPVASTTDLQAALKNYSAGDSAVLTVYRDGEVLTLDIVFDEKQPAAAEPSGATYSTEPNYPFGGFNW